MKQIMVVVLVAVVFTATAQISTTSVAAPVTEVKKAPYDSTANFLGEDVYQYVGQELYLKGKDIYARKYGYQDFITDYTNDNLLDQSIVYKCCTSHNSSYSDLAGKYFVVLEVIKHPRWDESFSYKKYYLKLKEKASGDIVYFRYGPKYSVSFPFVVVGYFNKLKETSVGKKEFVIRGMNWRETGKPFTDINTGKEISEPLAGSKWKCVDVTVEENYYRLSYVIQNDRGEKIVLPVDLANVTNWVFDAKDAVEYKRRFGNEKWAAILSGNVSLGMSKEMCRLSWGEPQKVNETITAGKVSEQWVYKEKYLYFDNGLLTAIQ